MKQSVKIVGTFLLLFVAAQSFAQIAYDVVWYYGGIQYRGLLILPQDGEEDWTYRVRYVSDGRVRMVDQTMSPVTYSDGVALHGCCARYAGTYTSCSTYSPDNLVVLQNGTAYNYDDNGQSRVYSIKPIYSKYTYNRLLNTVFHL